MGHILHQLDDLTDVIWVFLSKKNILHRLFLIIDVIYSFFYAILKFALLIRAQSHSITSFTTLKHQICVMWRGYHYIMIFFFIAKGMPELLPLTYPHAHPR